MDSSNQAMWREAGLRVGKAMDRTYTRNPYFDDAYLFFVLTPHTFWRQLKRQCVTMISFFRMTLSANMICLLIQWVYGDDSTVIFQDLLTSAWINAQYVFQVSMSAVEKVITMQADTAEKLVPRLTTRSISTAQSFEKMKVCCTNSMMKLKL